MKHTNIIIAALLLAPIAALSAADAPKHPSKPNIIFILADDLGFETLGCYGGKTYKQNGKVLGSVKTPNLDAMAKNGMLFKTCFATPVCSPARSEVLTGKYNFRTGFPDITGHNGSTKSLDVKTHPTVAMQLQAAGYITAVAGKWHLGPPESMREIPTTDKEDTHYPHPRECGFMRQSIIGGPHLQLYGEPKVGEYTPERLQKWVLGFLESRKGQADPFFLYYPSPLPHVPLKPTPLNPDGEKRAGYRGAVSNFPSVIQYLDEQVGELLKKLDELGMRENTLVIFSADNGTDQVTTELVDGREVKGGKATLRDTGSWVPLLASWPGKIKPGSIDDGLVDFTDIMPNCLEIAKAPVPNGIDGISFAPQLQGRPGQPREWVHSLYKTEYFVRDSKWKLRENGNLYDVSNSPFSESLVGPEKETVDAKSARQRLQGILDRLHT